MLLGRKELTEVAFKEQVQSLVGRELAGVLYFEIPYLNDDGSIPGPFWCESPDFDSLDFGLELITADGDRCWIGWGNQFYTYALDVKLNANRDRGLMREIDVSYGSRWEPLLGGTIAQAQVFWDWEAIGNGPPVWGPQDLAITFASGDIVYISALEIRQDSAPWGHMDNLTVFFGENVARLYPVGPYAPFVRTEPGDIQPPAGSC